MKKYKAYKTKYSKIDSGKYYIFLKQCLPKFDPVFYVITQKKKIETDDGGMYAIHMTKNLEIPNLDIIAEYYINLSYVYVWNDSLWTIAINSKSKNIMRPDNYLSYLENPQKEKTVVIYQINSKVL